jgi:phospholipase/carboxylesterase
VGNIEIFRNLSSDDFKNMVGQMEPIIANIQRQYPKFILGGFSQGAMLTSHLGPRLAVDGMILWSANLIDEDNMKLERNIPFIQSHGAQDPLLGIDGARGLYTKLKEGGFAGEFIEFAGEHTIPTEVIEKTKDFLTKVG